MIGCIIFDCDGTLVDSEELGNRVLAQHFQAHGVDVSVEQLLSEFRGGHFAEMLETVQRRHQIRLPDDFIEQFRALSTRAFEAELQAMPGAAELLSQLQLPLCVASNAPVIKTRHSLQLTALDGFFGDALFSAYDIDAWKPKPDLFLHAAEQMGFAPQECLVVEDSEAGVKAGLAAAMITLVLDPQGHLCGHEDAIRLQSLLQIPEQLKRLNRASR